MNKNNNNYLLNFQGIVSIILMLFCISSYGTPPIVSPLSVRLHTHNSEFTEIGKLTLIPLEMEIHGDWVSATIDFKVISSDRELSSNAIKIDPIVLNNQKQKQYPHSYPYPQITKTNINMVVNKEGLYEIEGIITVTLSNDSKDKADVDHLSDVVSFGVFSFQGKYVYDFSSQDALDKYAELNVINNAKGKIKKLINKAILNKARTGDNGLTEEQEREISRIVHQEELRIKELYNDKYHSIND